MHNHWINALTHQTNCLLTQQPGKVFHTMNREFESTLILCALAATGGCRIDAARLLGVGRNTITRKIHAFGLDSSGASPSQT
jgi:two-component system nitrogen regulation response regulator GlnG